jgi:hypothetical protein
MKIAIVEPKLVGDASVNTGRTPAENLVASAPAARLGDEPPSSASC